MHRAVTEWNQYRGDERKTARLEVGANLGRPRRRPAEHWTADLRDPVGCPPVVGRDGVYVGTTGGDLYALDFQGRRRWVYETDTSTTLTPGVSAEFVYCCLEDALIAIETKTGDPAWTREATGLYTTPPTLTDGLLLVGDAEGITAIRTETSEAIWASNLEAPPVGAIAVDDERVYVAVQDESVAAMDRDSGEEVWRAPADGVVVGGPTLADDRAYVADEGGTVLALDAETGQTWFTYKIDGAFTSSPTVLEGADTLFVAADDDTLHVTDTTFGNRKLRGLLFSKPGLPLDDAPATDPIVVGDTVLVGDRSGGLYGVDADDPDFRWHLPLEAKIASTPAPAFEVDSFDDEPSSVRLFVGNESGRLRCLAWDDNR
ncbi:PQQ-binding-like beta-propeller repeat protein [Natronosalvus halobius]|uniref:outer membrane protein assembly factor BamB family protein n=1 Tax=Natronosalvus halobius TaxID=2953746 RepID=UPI0020A0B3E4|nr:PQQ-binding-like beta-propeller repeat protein [Natronosalvus halobius]USZ70483.1 PQQ-like beta-propeller repeat protein [Natronosalvus halobius]